MQTKKLVLGDLGFIRISCSEYPDCKNKIRIYITFSLDNLQIDSICDSLEDSDIDYAFRYGKMLAETEINRRRMETANLLVKLEYLKSKLKSA